MLRFKIDGKTRTDLIKRWASTKAFALPIPDDNVCGFPIGVYASVDDGYFAILPALEPGFHTIHFQGSVEEFDVTWGVRYRLHSVKPAKELKL